MVNYMVNYMDEETLIKKILSEEIPKQIFDLGISLEFTQKEIKILSMAFGLEDEKAHNLEKVCKRFKITKSQYKRILRKVLKKYDEKIHRPLGAKRGWRYSYLSPLDFPNFEEFKNFVRKLYEKGYAREKTMSGFIWTDVPLKFLHLFPNCEIWISHKKARKCYIFTFSGTTENKEAAKFLEDLFNTKKK